MNDEVYYEIIEGLQEENEKLREGIKETALDSIRRYQRSLSSFNALEAENDWLEKRIKELEKYIRKD